LRTPRIKLILPVHFCCFFSPSLSCGI
jgi:hypothetical protein